MDEGSILIRGVKCQVICPALPWDRVLVYHYPYKNDDRQVERALSQFGLVKEVSYQSWVGLKDVHTGTRVVRMNRTTRIPRSIMIDGFRCKIWYRGQPVTCDVCREEDHVAAKCSKKGTCFNCRQPGHMSRDCPDRSYGRGAWGQPARGVSWVSGPDGAAGGGPPAVESPCIEQVSVDGSSLSVGDVPSCPSVLSGGSSSSVEGGAPDCRGSPPVVASCPSNVSSVASVCDSNVVDDNGLLIDKVSNGNSSNVMDNAVSNVSGDPPISNVSNIVNASKVRHCLGKFFPVYGSLDWPSTWRSLSFFDPDRQVTDLCWKIAHGVLYTAQRLVSFGLPVPPSCFCGSPVESLEHLFFFCPLAQSVLSWLQSLLFSFSFMCPALLCRHVLFGFSSDELIVTPRVFVYLLNLCKYFIWQSRNDFRFRAVRPGAAAVIARVKSRLRFHLPIFFKRFQSARRRRFFHRQWGARGVIATVSDGHLSLAL